MLTKKQIDEIRQHLDKAQNPVFFFDNDPDGLCSFLLLQRYIERGKGVPIKSFPELTEDYFRKVNELNADYIFILDKPVVSQEFFKRVEEINMPIVWIDHHTIDKKQIPDFVHYYNPLFNKDKHNEPVTVLCQQINNNKKDLWLAVVGGISDKFVPDFYSDFEKSYPELSIKSESAFEIFYNSQIGKIVKLFSFALKDKTTNVINMLKFLMKVKTPYEVLEKTSKNYTMHERFDQIDRRYQKLLIKAEEISVDSEKVLFFQYGGDMSISSDLANELNYRFPEKIIVVLYFKGIKANISVRGKKIKDKILEAIKNLEGATGGGHEDAVGAQINVEDIEKFREKLLELVE
ncbi:DHH family phosphoesterase [Candidatus Pacearchaeota archaeon]|nr:DHH family phosphoesterase [Candidatus Pacearchaeota archaeon]